MTDGALLFESFMLMLIGMGIVFFYAVLGGMKGITYTQVAQYCVLIFAYMVPAFFISLLTNVSQLTDAEEILLRTARQLIAEAADHLNKILDPDA